VPFVRTSCLPVRHRPGAFIDCTEDGMSEMEKKDDIQTEEFTDELSDEALDREQGGGKSWCVCASPLASRADN
jgi:hypothetical protein